ncbi:hypothetical protein F2Q68_00024860 [Brassica cretica]|uniref:Uncharacterized protein n=1 Tax=Brassica cretica TaxID=69181 RepID=A0A8S9IDH8_BRACR|nr:hypothetical protein F2Q68_00024860 [Brassica cretica]
MESLRRYVDLNVDRWEDLNVDRRQDLNVDRRHDHNVDRHQDLNVYRHQPDEIDRQPPHIIDLHPPDIDRHRQPLIDRHYPPNIDRCPLLDVPPGCIIEMEPIEERMYMSKASDLAVPKHQRPPIWTEEADGLRKRVKMIPDPVKIVVPCAVVEIEFPIPPDRKVKSITAQERQHRSSPNIYHRSTLNTSPSIDTTTSPSIDTATSPSIDTTPSPSIDTTTSSSLDTGRVSEQREFDVCGNLRDGDTTTQSDKSGGKKRRN